MKALLIDAYYLAHRVHSVFQNPHRLQQYLKNSKEEPTGMQYGSLLVIRAIVKEIKPNHIYFCWDQKPVAKLALFPGYKADRQSVGTDFYEAVQRMRHFWDNFNVTHVHSHEQEADDVIASVIHQHCSNPGDQSFILSTDNDYLQLVKDGKVIVIKPPMGKQPAVYVDEEYIRQEWGVEPALMPHLRALLGDSSDKLPGIPRFGQKKAADLINAARSVQTLYDHYLEYVSRLSVVESQKLKAHREIALRNLQLMRMAVDLPLVHEKHEFSRDGLEAALTAMESKSFLSQLDELQTDFTHVPRLITW